MTAQVRMGRWAIALSFVVAFVVGVSVVGAGCDGDSAPGPPDLALPPIIGLTIVGPGRLPPALNVSCKAAPSGPSPESLALRALCVDVRTGAERDVTDEVLWRASDPRSLLVDSGNQRGVVRAVCPLPHGGPQPVTVEGACGRATVAVGLFYEAPDVLAGRMPPSPGDFDGPASPRGEDQPVVVYPLDGALHPLNLPRLTFQWRAPAKQTHFRLAFTGPFVRRSVFVAAADSCTPDPKAPSTQRCVFLADGATLASITRSAAGGDVMLGINGIEGPHGTRAASATHSMKMSPEWLRGALFYSDSSPLALRRVGLHDDSTVTLVDRRQPLQCVGCHAASADGRKLAGTGYGRDGAGVILDASTGTVLAPAPGAPALRWNWATFSPDGHLLLTGWAGQFTLRDARTGERKFDVDAAITGGPAIQPEWSPDGTQVAFVRVPPGGKIGRDFVGSGIVAGDWIAANTGDIAVMKWDGTAFAPARVLVPSMPGDEYHYFPTWSPESDHLAFVTASAPGFSPTAWASVYGNRMPPVEYRDYVMTFEQQSTRLRLVAASGGKPIELTAASDTPGSWLTWPRFHPRQQGKFVFLGFTARLAYGFLVDAGTRSQLWVAGVDLLRADLERGETDPSFPPVWLPYQDPRSDNYGGAWNAFVPCARSDDCGDTFQCVDGRCVPAHQP